MTELPGSADQPFEIDGEPIGSIYDPIGHRFGRLVSVSLVMNAVSRGVTSVLFRCDCGKHRRVPISALRNKTMPETCKHCERDHVSIEPERKIGDFLPEYRSEYDSWRKYRKTFGKRWSSFPRFITDMGHRPPNHSLCRKDVSKKHSPENSYWGPINETSAARLCVAGETMSTIVFCRRFKIPRDKFAKIWAKTKDGDELLRLWDSIKHE